LSVVWLLSYLQCCIWNGQTCQTFCQPASVHVYCIVLLLFSHVNWFTLFFDPHLQLVSFMQIICLKMACRIVYTDVKMFAIHCVSKFRSFSSNSQILLFVIWTIFSWSHVCCCHVTVIASSESSNISFILSAAVGAIFLDFPLVILQLLSCF